LGIAAPLLHEIIREKLQLVLSQMSLSPWRPICSPVGKSGDAPALRTGSRSWSRLVRVGSVDSQLTPTILRKQPVPEPWPPGTESVVQAGVGMAMFW
jgi:hypothetical protein